MQKIPTIYERDWDNDPSRVTPKPNPDCAWVFSGQGVATRQYDGSACLIAGGKLYRREAVRDGKPRPEQFVFVAHEEGRNGKPGKDIGWTPVGDGPQDRWHREAFEPSTHLADGTYELVGPKVQGNPEHYDRHALIRHDLAEQIAFADRTFEGIALALDENDVEGFVFHHPDGRMAKIKKRDFGLHR